MIEKVTTSELETCRRSPARRAVNLSGGFADVLSGILNACRNLFC
jgi:hypothetical protein